MGEPMAANLVAGGVSLVVHDTRHGAAVEFARRTGAVAAGSAAELGAGADVVIAMLPDGDAVAAAMLGGDSQEGVAQGLAPGSLLVDMSSVAPAQTRALGTRLAEARIRMVDAPVSGGVGRAEAGALAIMAGGEAADVRACAPLFDLLGQRTIHTGGLGTGHAVKALNNAVSAAGLIAAGEALIVGQRAGVDPAVMLEVLNASTGRNNATENKIERFVFSRAFDSGFALRLMAKDVGIAEELAEELGFEPVLLGELARIAGGAAEQLEPHADHTAIVRWMEQQAGEPALGSGT